MSYRNLEIWKLARELAVDIHRMTITKLPKFEMFEQGSQVRRSAHSIRSNIVVGYGRRRYKQDYPTYSLASCDETIDHLEALFDSGSLADSKLYQAIHSRIEILAKKINLFLQSVERSHLGTKPIATV